ncbi:MAG: sulfatase [Halodesulfurarchaeum sp.]
MSPSSETVENVVLITVDSLRADAISPYTSGVNTPTVERLAQEGTVFEKAFAHANWTPMSFPSILASRPVFADTGTIGVSGLPTLAERLADAGIATAGFNAANGFLTAHWGYDEGFGDFEPFIEVEGDHKYSEFIAAHPTVAGWLQLAMSPFRKLRAKLGRHSEDVPFTDTSRLLDIERRATSFLEDVDDEKPFFLWLHYMDAHTPYVPAPRYLRESAGSNLRFDRMIAAQLRAGLGWTVGEETLSNLRTLYQGAVRQVDDSIDRLLSTLAEEGLADETAVLLTGDHGEEFMEHGHLAHYPKLYDELIHVPLVASIPGVGPGRVSEHVGLDAIAPTICELLDVDPSEEWAGDSFLSVVEGKGSPPADPVVSVTVRGEDITQQPIPRSLEDGDLLVSARTGEWTYIENVETSENELYHRHSDPDQLVDRSDDDDGRVRDVCTRFRAVVREHVAMLDTDDTESESEDLDESIEKQLNALGYR